MQLKTKLSLIACSLLIASTSVAEDYVSVQYMHYDEGDNRASISSPSIELNKDFGVDYSLKLGITADSVSGASPTWYDASSGASTYSRGKNLHVDDIEYSNIKYEDDRKAANLLFTTRFKSRDELSVGINYSSENDYRAKEVSASYLHYSDASKNQSLSFGISYQANEIDVTCIENSICDASSGASGTTEDLNVVSTELGLTQILDENSLTKVSIFYTNEDGYLSNPYMNVVRGYTSESSLVDVVAENKPDTRESYGAVLQYISALSNRLSVNTSYRFYNDDWDINSHTISSEIYYEFTNDLRVGAGLRYYNQSEANFYSNTFFSNEEYASSDERMRSFDAIGYKSSLDYRVSKALSTNIGFNYYDQLDSFNAIYLNLGLKYRF